MDYLAQAERALEYLQQSEEDYARLKAGHQAEKERLKVVRAAETLESCENTQKGKEMAAEASEAFRQALDDWQEFMEAFYLIEAKRKRAELTIEMYRSVNAAQKRGNI